MKHLSSILFTLCAMALTLPNTGFADNNEIGFYTDMEQSAVQIDINGGQIFYIFVMIHNPYNDDLDIPVEAISGFEFATILPNGLVVLSVNYPGDAVNFAGFSDQYLVGFGEPLNVTQGAPTLILTLHVYATSSEADQFIYVQPYSSQSDAIFLHLINNQYYAIPMNNIIGGDFSNPIFAINPTEQIVAVDHLSFDGVKALYR